MAKQMGDVVERNGLKLVLGLMCLLVSWSLAMADSAGKVAAELQAFKVLATKDGGESFVRASVARPGEVIEYRIKHTNGTGAALSGFVVNGAIPTGTAYVAGSESKTDALVFQAKVKDGKKRTVEVQPRDYAAVRWLRREALAAKAESSIKYRVQVAQ